MFGYKMEKLPMCRICLAENIRMCVVVNKNLHKLYERLTDIPFVTEDSRPMLACSICCVKLKQCCRFMMKCLEAEELFAQMTSEDYEQNPIVKQDQLQFFGGLMKTSVQNISIVDVGLTECVIAKEELPAVCESLDDIIDHTEEHQCDDLELKNQHNSRLDEADTLAHGSEDDLPLMEFKIEKEEEHEAPKENVDTKSPAVAEEPKLYLRRTKLEDSIPAEQKTNQTSDSKLIRATQNRKSKFITKFKKPHECEVCHYTFSHKRNLTNHVRTHTGVKPYKCDICPCSFSKKTDLTRHIRTHTGEKPYKCDICQRSFSQKGNLNSHIRSHTGEKPYKCDICQRGFSDKSTLTSHVRTHTGVKPYKCDICPCSFSIKGNLTNHILTHTGEKPYKCDICQRSFSLKSNLTSHFRSHTGEKPYKCDMCPCSFSFKGTLAQHIRIHTGEKPYKCDICQCSFSQKAHLAYHIRTHTREKPYKCKICLNSFSRKSHLTRHIRIHL